jgi:hypothetical protein
MNKLRKPPPSDYYSGTTSRAFAYASSQAPSSAGTLTHVPPSIVSTTTIDSWKTSQHPGYKDAPQPRTATEQYWAARALTAETLLAAKDTHQLELKETTSAEDAKRKVCYQNSLPVFSSNTF